jgi:hypothetical protein
MLWARRLTYLLCVLLTALVGGSPGAYAKPRGRAASTALSPATPMLFAPGSVWNQRLAADAPIDPQSAPLVQALAAEAQRESIANVGPWISTSSYSTPIYIVGARQPAVYVALDEPTLSWRAGLQAAFAAVPIPAEARQAAGTDAQLTVYQPSTDRLWELWKASKQASGWHAAWGGAIEHVSQSPGYYTVSSWAHSAANWGASASSLPLVAGTMTIAELRSGQINHALAMETPFPRQGVYTWPAQRTDGLGTSSTDLPEGIHLRLDPNLNIPALHLPPITEEMALAAQRYGIIVRDQSHHAIGFYGEDPTPTGSDPYHGTTGFYRGMVPSQFLGLFPWRRLEVLKMNLHSS